MMALTHPESLDVHRTFLSVITGTATRPGHPPKWVNDLLTTGEDREVPQPQTDISQTDTEPRAWSVRVGLRANARS